MAGLEPATTHLYGTPGNNLAPYGKGARRHGARTSERVAVEQFIHRQNLTHYRRLLAAPDQTDDARRQTILKLLADEMSKDDPLPRMEA